MWKSGGQARRDIWQNPSWFRSQYRQMWEQPNYFLLFVFDRLFLTILFVSVILIKYTPRFTENEIMVLHLTLWLKVQVIKSIVLTIRIDRKKKRYCWLVLVKIKFILKKFFIYQKASKSAFACSKSASREMLHGRSQVEVY